jgi:hypothetical protein
MASVPAIDFAVLCAELKYGIQDWKHKNQDRNIHVELLAQSS